MHSNAKKIDPNTTFITWISLICSAYSLLKSILNTCITLTISFLCLTLLSVSRYFSYFFSYYVAFSTDFECLHNKHVF